MKKQLKRSFVAIIGSVVVVAGIIMIPYPGPGWLVVFAGLGILSTEFEWAQRVLDFAKAKYDGWVNWVSRQNAILKAAIWLMTAAVVIVTVWLINGYGFINHLLHLGIDWIDSPLFT